MANFHREKRKGMKPEKKPTKPDSPTTASVDLQLNDIGFRLVLIPFFGIAIPLVTNMIPAADFTHWQLKLAYGYTILLAFVIWQGNRYLLFTLRSYFDWFNRPVRKIIALLLAVSFFTIPISVLMLVGWYNLFRQGMVNWNVVFTSTLIIMICVVFITHVYETVFLVKESEGDKVKSEQMERAKAEAELEALKNQIDPHFIFNSLNTLSHLIEEQPSKAKAFNDHMADVYRYILQNKGRDLVMLEEEIAFLQDYFSLLQIRFEKAVALQLYIPKTVMDQYLLPPISLQVLAENAVKHNEFSDSNPLALTIELIEDTIMVKNTIHRRALAKPTSKVGLHNLNERYKLIAGKALNIDEADNTFTVVLPLLKIE